MSDPTSLSNPTGFTDPDALLPTTSVVALVVDSAHHRLFISTGSASNSLLVTNNSGTLTHTLNLAGASGMTLSGKTLFVAERGAGDIAEINTSTLNVTKRISTGANSCPNSLALVADRYLTFGLDCDIQTGRVAVIDLQADGLPLNLLPGSLYNPLVRAVPNSTHAIVGQAGLDPSGVSLIDVTGVPSTLTSVWDLVGDCENLGDLAVSPDGQTFVAACGAPYRHDVYSTSNLTLVDSYPTGTYPDAAAFSADGREFAGGTGFSYGNVLYVLSTAPGAHTLGLARSFGTPWGSVPQGVAFSADGGTVFDITDAWFGTGTWTYRLHAIAITKTPVAYYVSAPRTWAVGTQLQIAGRLTFSDGQARAVQLQVTRKQNGHTSQLLPVTTTLGDNSFFYTDTPGSTGTATYTFRYAGDPFHDAGKVVATVDVQRIEPALAIGVQVGKNGAATVTATLVGGSSNRAVTIAAKPNRGRAITIANGKVSDLGVLATSYHLTSTTTFTATYTGDGQYRPATATTWASPDVVTPPAPPVPTQRATIAIENTTTDTIVVQLADPEVNQTFTVDPGQSSAPFAYATLGTTQDALDVRPLSGPDAPQFMSGSYFQPDHSYLLRIVYEPSQYNETNGGQLLTWQIVQSR